MKLKCRINEVDYDIVQGASFTDNFNETLDSGTICIDQVEQIVGLKPYDDVFIWDSQYEFKGYYQGQEIFTPSGTNVFYKHLLVNDFTEEMLNLERTKYKYTINLFSETKRLEKVQCPNLSITQSLNVERKRSCWFYLQQYLKLYSPKIKMVTTAGLKSIQWKYAQKYTLDPSLESVFKDTICPEMSWTNPSLRDILHQIMVVKDMIPYVHNDVIKALDIGNINGTFDREIDENGNSKSTNFSVGSMTSSDYATDVRREYSNALSQEKSTRFVEYMGFRSPNSPFLTLSNMVLETRFPIYKINKIEMCYYKNISIVKGDGVQTRYAMLRFNITPLVLQNVVRSALSQNWEEFKELTETDLDSLEEAAKFKLCTVGYDIGSNVISGWGTTYSYLDGAWFTNAESYIENLVNLVEKVNEFGELTNTEIFGGIIGEDYHASYGKGINYIICPQATGTAKGEAISPNDTDKIKSIFFKIDYDGMYSGAVVHPKQNIENDDIISTDNCSSALTILENDGLLQKEKMDRLGNKSYRIPARYDADNGGANPSRVQPVGSYDSVTDAIIYAREYSIYDNVIFTNYQAVHEYILKNYFTSVWARHRTYSLMSYSESVHRAENFRELLLLSEDKLYFEDEGLIHSDPSITKELLSCFEESKLDSNCRIIKAREINCGYFDYPSGTHTETGATYGGKFLSDINVFSNGYNLCFNIKTYDNISAGNYVDHLTNASVLDLLIGELDLDGEEALNYRTTQQWYCMVDNKEDAFTENIGIYVCHGDFSELFDEDGTKFSSAQDTPENCVNKSLALPKIPNNLTRTYKIGKNFNICKDNKELLDTTLQFSYLSGSKNVFLSPWVAKLNNLMGAYEKFNGFREAPIGSNSNAAEVIVWCNIEQAKAKGICFGLKIKKDIIDQGKLGTNSCPITMEKGKERMTGWAFTYITSLGGTVTGTDHGLSGISTEMGLGLKSLTNIGNNKIKMQYFFYGYESGKYSVVDKTNTIANLVVLGCDFEMEKWENDSNDPNYYYYYAKLTETNAIYYQTVYFNVLNYWKNDLTGFSKSQGYENASNVFRSSIFVANHNVKKVAYKKNMYIVSSTQKITNALLQNDNYKYSSEDSTISTMPSYLTVQEDLIVNNVFSPIINKDGSPMILVNPLLRRPNGAYYFTSSVQSVQYYYRDENNYMHFVFGVNLPRKETSSLRPFGALNLNAVEIFVPGSGYQTINKSILQENGIDFSNTNGAEQITTPFYTFNIYLSCVSKRSAKVYNMYHQYIGDVINYADPENEIEYGVGQYFKRK